MNWNNIKITIKKEIRGIIRDKKSLQKLILYPLLIPFVILLFGFLFDTMSESTYYVGINYDLTKEEKVILEEYENIKLKKYDSKEKLEKKYENNEIAAYIVKEDNKYTVHADTSQNSGGMALSYATSYLETYNSVLGTNYLVENNIDPNNVYQNIIIETETFATDEEGTDYTLNLILSLVITYVIMIITMVCTVVVTDATSGEKERGTLETILTFPIKCSELVVGKYLATAILSFIVGLVSYGLSVPSIYLGTKIFKAYELVELSTKFSSYILAIFIIFLAALLAAGLCMALAGNAKTYKEAQSSLQMITILPMIPYFLQIMEVSGGFLNLIPIANCGFALNEIVINQGNMQSILVIILSSIVYIVLILMYISKQYKEEKTLFS